MDHDDYTNDGYTCFYCHTSYEKDLQLAAELGKTLLERNKELETNLRQQQNVVEDRDQEIEYLTKQTAALREVNDSRLRIYEQLEISIQDLERNNQKLVLETANDKKHIKSLYETIESLENRCEDLQHLVDDMGHSKIHDGAAGEGGAAGVVSAVDDRQDEYARLVSQLDHAKNQRAKEQRKVSELEQNVSLLIQENTSLEEKVCVMQQKDEELKTLQDQIVYLEEMRQGNLCRRCQRSTDPNLFDEYSVYDDDDNDNNDDDDDDDDDQTDDISAIGSYVETHKHEVLQQLQETLGEKYSENNPYRILVDKYEALLKIQQKHNAFAMPAAKNNNQGVSLQEELQMSGQFSSFNGCASSEDSDDETADVTGQRVAAAASGDGGTVAPPQRCKYSETETASSSGFSDETSNKCTQTETFFTGSFLCTISDGDDCRFSIYDDASPVESRFRKTPEYRQLFREMFAVLKRAAEAKDEGEKLPLLQDDAPAAPKVPPATPACEHNPLMSSIEEKMAAEDAVDRCPGTVSERRQQQQQQQRQQQRPRRRRRRSSSGDSRTTRDHDHQQQRTGQQPADELVQQTRRRRDIIEELASAAVKHKKHHARHRKPASSSSSSKQQDISHLMDFKWTDQLTRTTRGPGNRADGGRGGAGSSRSVPKDDGDAAATSGPAGGDSSTGREEPAAPYASSASQEVAKLKLLEKSYAEVLRLRNPPANRPRSQYFNRM